MYSMKKIITHLIALMVIRIMITSVFGKNPYKKAEKKGFNRTQAVFLGEFIEVSRKMLEDDPENLNPAQPEYFPEGWKIIGNLNIKAGFFDRQEKFIGFFAQSIEDLTECILIIHGTSSAVQMFENFKTDQTRFKDIKKGGFVETGFLNVYETMTVIDTESGETYSIKEFTEELVDGNIELAIAGYSLGSALATLHAAVTAYNSPSIKLEVYTFASPLVGNGKFAGTYNKLVPLTFRIFNKPDIVTQIPPPELDFKHVNNGVEINSLNHPVKNTAKCKHSIYTYLYILGSEKYRVNECVK